MTATYDKSDALQLWFSQHLPQFISTMACFAPYKLGVLGGSLLFFGNFGASTLVVHQTPFATFAAFLAEASADNTSKGI